MAMLITWQVIKRASLDEWVTAVNEHGEFGMWTAAVSRSPGDVAEILNRTSSNESAD